MVAVVVEWSDLDSVEMGVLVVYILARKYAARSLF